MEPGMEPGSGDDETIQDFLTSWERAYETACGASFKSDGR